MKKPDCKCCPIGSEPALFSDYVPTGEELMLGDMKVYTKGDSPNGMIIIHDVYGYNGGRTKLICDQLADLGYRVYLPDFYRGETIETLGLQPLVQKFTWDKTVKKDLKTLMKKVDQDKVEKIGLMGFCWGAYPIFMACSESDRFSFGISFHPSLGIFEMINDYDKSEIAKKLKAPQMIAIAGNDPDYYRSGGDIYEILKNKFHDNFAFYDFPKMKHGFVCRGDVTDPIIKKDVKSAMMDAVHYMKKMFK